MSPPASEHFQHARNEDRPDGRIARGDNRRAAILEAASREFGRRGYETARIADIARAAGVTDAGLLHHFSTKKDLFLAVVELRESVYAPFSDMALVSARVVFDAFIATATKAEQEPDLARFRMMLTGAAALEGHPVAGRAGENLRRALGALEPVLRAAIDSGELRDEVDPRQVVLELFALNDGIRSLWASWPEGVAYAQTYRTAVNALYDRIAAKPSAS